MPGVVGLNTQSVYENQKTGNKGFRGIERTKPI
jgi:hypothetical protein